MKLKDLENISRVNGRVLAQLQNEWQHCNPDVPIEDFDLEEFLADLTVACGRIAAIRFLRLLIRDLGLAAAVELAKSSDEIDCAYREHTDAFQAKGMYNSCLEYDKQYREARKKAQPAEAPEEIDFPAPKSFADTFADILGMPVEVKEYPSLDDLLRGQLEDDEEDDNVPF